MMELIVSRLDRWFAERLRGLQYSPEALAYVAGILSTKKWDLADMSNESVVLAYQGAQLSGDFSAFQRIGDWVLFVDAVHPQHFNGVRDTVETLGRLSYYRCYRLMGGQWRVYEELADELPLLAAKVRRRLV
jgi:hypothetical protein